MRYWQKQAVQSIPFKSLVAGLLLLVATHAAAGAVSHHHFESNVLNRSYAYNLYMPDGYEETSLRYPVMYLLHGASGSEHSWVNQGNVQETADALIAAGVIPAQLIVMPADPNFWWANSREEAAQRAFIEELIPHVDATYRTLAMREGRVVGGYSAGGFGTTNAALRFPHLFSAAAALSPAVYDPVPPPSSSAVRIGIFQTDGKFDPALWKSMNWVSFIDAYRAQDLIVPFYINSGDHDRFDIAYHAAAFYQTLREHQPQWVELRIFDGDHDFAAWGGSLGDAMQYLARFLTAPQ
jgi:enterochelin esterase-like enzyme